MKAPIWKLLPAFFILFVTVNLGMKEDKADAAIALRYGSEGYQVWSLQYRLKTLNLYKGALDAHYGPGTKNGVLKFQKEYGTYPDGKAGPATWRQLKKYTLSKSEMNIMAKVIYSEARGEPYKGQVAVGAVVMNRIQSKQFPNNIKDVVFQKNAFTAVADGQFNKKPNKTAYLAAKDAVRGWDPTKNSLYYFNPKTATSDWIWSRKQNVRIGRHIFAS